MSSPAKEWTMTDALSNVAATSRASKVSYVMGKHTFTLNTSQPQCESTVEDKVLVWSVTNNTWISQPKKPFHTYTLKLTGCDQDGEFTCDDGQCVRMEKRCNQLSDCRDESDEVNCYLLVLEKKTTTRRFLPSVLPMAHLYPHKSTPPWC